MTGLKGEGYIVTDGGGLVPASGLIHGVGRNAGAAMADAIETLRKARITVVLHDDPVREDSPGAWMRESDLVTIPATAALMAAVCDRGGSIGWSKVGGVACTPAEEREQGHAI